MIDLELINAITVIAQGGGQDPAAMGEKAGRAIALGAGAGGGAAGAGAGIGSVFGASIAAKTRQPELRCDIERDQCLGFALTEACFFYGLVGGLIAFFL